MRRLKTVSILLSYKRAFFPGPQDCIQTSGYLPVGRSSVGGRHSRRQTPVRQMRPRWYYKIIVLAC